MKDIRKTSKYIRLAERIRQKPVPEHVAIIMDGNGRWAKAKGKIRTYGHRHGVERLRDILRACVDIGVHYLTIYAFSTENWTRPDSEVSYLLDLFVEYLENEMPELNREGVRVHIIGDRAGLPDTVNAAVDNMEEKTSHNDRIHMNIAFNYGGRDEIIRAARALASEVLAGQIKPGDIDEDAFASHLYTAGMPDPDLLIRTGGDQRVSNFLLYQLAYCEFYVTSGRLYWPDFSPIEFFRSILAYQQRQRRFGGVITGGKDVS